MMSLLFSGLPPLVDQVGRIVTQLSVSEGRRKFSSCNKLISPQEYLDGQEAYAAIGKEEQILAGQVAGKILGLPLLPAVP